MDDGLFPRNHNNGPPLEDEHVPEWGKGEAPHEVGRARFGPIAIANSDAAAAAYTDAAIDQAHRAVEELLTR